jgi:hypothetical protein
MAYFAEKDYFSDPEALARGQERAEGKMQLEWFAVENERAKAAARDARRGLTYEDCNLGRYGYDALPEYVRDNYSMAARGSVLVPGLPDLGYTVNRKSDVWADNVPALYEEAKSRRWVPAVDVDWAAIGKLELDPGVQAAICQLCTVLEEIALAVMEFPSRWVSAINQEFLELKSLQCAQMIDQARHVEAFRKRALAGGGLKRASATIEQALKELVMAETYPEGVLGIYVLLGRLLVEVFGEAGTVSDPDARMFRLCAQDTARSLAYGTAHVRYHIDHQRAAHERLHDYLDRSEHCLVGIAASPELLEPLIVIASGSARPDRVAAGRTRIARLLDRTVVRYMERCRAAGLDRKGRSRLEAFFA